MALRDAVRDHVARFDVDALFNWRTAAFQTPEAFRDKLLNTVDQLFSQYRHLLDIPPEDTWIAPLWDAGAANGYQLSIPANPHTSLDCDQVLSGTDPTPPNNGEPFDYFWRRGKVGQYRWNLNPRFQTRGGGICSVIGSQTPTIPDHLLSACWTKIGSAIASIGAYSPATCDAHSFYADTATAHRWTNYADLSGLFHLVFPQFFPALYRKTAAGYSQLDGISRLLDDVAGSLGVSRKAVNLYEYEGYARSYRLLLIVYDEWARKMPQTPHFDYFTEFLAELDNSAANWRDLLLIKKALVLYGVPGTGKTHMARILAGEIAQPEHVGLVQFHPSYSYQDFILGIRPQVDKNGDKVLYPVVPGLLYRAAAEAADALQTKDCAICGQPATHVNVAGVSNNGESLESKIEMALDENRREDREDGLPIAQNVGMDTREEDQLPSDPDKSHSYVLIIDEINRADLAKVLGEVMYCIEYRGPVCPKHKEKGEIVLPNGLTRGTEIRKVFGNDTSTITDPFEGGTKFYIPENLYIIGTMNHADRSISGFDMALRRRFGWVRADFSETALREMLRERLGTEVPRNLDQYVFRARQANDKIRAGTVGDPETFSDHIPTNEDHLIGHTYFAEIAGIYQKNPMSGSITPWHLERLWLYFIEPLLEDYIGADVHDYRGQLNQLKRDFIAKL